MADNTQQAAPATGAPRSSAPTRKSSARFLLLLLVLAGLAGGGWWWWKERIYETTDDAFIAGHVGAIAPQVDGRVLEVLVTDNQEVAAGQVLVRIDPAPFQVKLDQARANLHEARQKLEESRSQLTAARAAVESARFEADSNEAEARNAHTDLVRYRQLVRTGAVSQQALDNAETLARTTTAELESSRKRVNTAQAQADLAAAQIRTAEAAIERFKALVAQEELDLAYCEIKALQGGRVTNKNVEAGDYIQVGQALFNLVLDELWVEANFKETQLTDMRPGQPVQILIDAYPDLKVTGRVDSIQAGTGAAFSLLPPQNANGNYVKVVQRVPVKIVFDPPLPGHMPLLGVGMSVVPKVQVRQQ
ncbi:HlyD family secretion protein [Megalodesulfovibrio paquesii]